jgi:CDP-glucose 4,6-dehydratase
MYPDFKDVRALVTGHTGFKGGWLTEWLKRAGASVTGLALPPENGPASLFEAARIAGGMSSSVFGDIRDWEVVRRVTAAAEPEIIFHLAAQPIVRRSYRDPLTTFATNVMGTAHVLEAARQCPSVRAIVCVTTDKVYRNRKDSVAFREDDVLGGDDPYSASKACAELVAASYQQTMLPLAGNVRLATARGGNVIGGGDWSEDRLIPDLVHALRSRRAITLRNPTATRPWQHVLELVRAYVVLGRKLLNGEANATGAWNFGPRQDLEVPVGTLATAFLREWGTDTHIDVQPSSFKEHETLRLDISKASAELGWTPVLDFAETVAFTVDWYRRACAGEDAARLTAEQIEHYQQTLGA